MLLTVSEVECDVKSITFSEKNYGRSSDEQGEVFKLTCPVDYFFERFRPTYDECIAELIRDDSLTRKFHPPYSGARRYPTLNEFVGLPEESRMEMIDTYFVFDILRIFFEEESYDVGTQWNVVRLDSLEGRGGTITLKGKAVPVLPG
jgi:hypothetical protein